MRVSWVGLFAVCLFSLGCFEVEEVEPPVQPTPFVQVSAEAMTFSTLLAGETERQLLTVTNTGDHTLVLENLALSGSSCFVVDDTDTSKEVEPGSSTEVWVAFTPNTDGTFGAELYVLSNDSEGAEPVITLTGGGQAPVIELSPAVHEFAAEEVGCEQEQEIVIHNAGSLRLDVDSLTFEPSSEELEFNYYFPGWLHLDPGENESVIVYYTPLDETPDTATLTITSNDPLTPEAVATQQGTAYLAQQVTDEVVWDTIDRADILWVVDNSESMAGYQEYLATNFSTFMTILDIMDLDYHVAVVTTDDPVFRGDVPVMTPATPDVEDVFIQTIDVGTSGVAGPNTGLQTGLEALSPPLTDPGGSNEGFLRANAGLRVLYVSDSDDASNDDVADYVAAYQALLADPDELVFSAIVDTATAVRYPEAAQHTGGLVEDIINPNWINTLIGWLPLCKCIGDDYSVELSQVPVEETIEVEVNGIPVTCGWYYDGIYNAVVFEPDFAPDQGDSVTIRYNILGTC